MGERWRIGSEGSNQNAKVRLSRLAARQCGRVSRSQVRDLGIGKATITAWIDDGYLHRIHIIGDVPGVRMPTVMFGYPSVPHLPPEIYGHARRGLPGYP